jgi:hypothetical protein
VAVADRLGRYRAGSAAPGSELARLQAGWQEIAGRQAAANSVVVRRSRAGLVSVACASAAWAQELDARRDVLRDRLGRLVPETPVAAIRFVVGDHVIPGVGTERARPRVRPSAEEIAAARTAVADVSDPVLRDLLERAAAGQMAVARAKRKSLQRGKNTGRAARGG